MCSSLINFLVLSIKALRKCGDSCQHVSIAGRAASSQQQHRNIGQKQEVFSQNCAHNDRAAQTHFQNMDVVQGQMVQVLTVSADNPCVFEAVGGYTEDEPSQ